MTIKDFTVGQTAYILGLDNWGRRLSDAEVIKVGRKYVTVVPKGMCWEMRFSHKWEGEPYLVEDTDCGSPRMLFLSMAALDEYVETQEIRRYICKAIDWSKIRRYSLEQLRDIKKILER